ncbi:sensor histidine kinase [Bifidobacterium vespertilionis]|uniref:histidine kinase n=1 Tax=Bifidobacterium vespertilionis TaxID=2562524 RepID=A0A5J5E6E6_9BIFI|nr:hypothetical protein [Bifidobacterium vespertilionis]KAA8821668.1 hypothetical protein EMO90_03320 [Bifidobacterium vespertilionis]KAA8824748.1 hypothetical protein EM848_00615 [Bifidobacterium vespertilionis]
MSWKYALEKVRPRAMHIVAVFVCLSLAVSELDASGFDWMTWPSRIISIAYMASLVVLPIFPVPSSVAIAMVALAQMLMPVRVLGYVTIQSLWGLWYALIVLALERSVWASGAIVAAFALLSVAQGERPFRWGIMHVSVMGMLPFFLIALAVGASMHVWRTTAREQARAQAEAAAEHALLEQRNRQQQERLNMLHQLHDSVAGTLTYAVMQCREAQLDCSEEQRIQYERIESTVEDALNVMRSRVIEPTRRLMREDRLENDGKSDISGGADAVRPVRAAVSPVDASVPSDDVDARTILDMLDHVAKRLRHSGYRCETLLRGDSSLLGDHATAIVRQALEEIGNNILKHGVRGYCVIMVTCAERKVTVWSSNIVDGSHCVGDRGGKTHVPQHDGLGLELIRRRVALLGGSLATSCEDGEWTTIVTIPSDA